MNKTELIEHIAQRADISKSSASRALEAVIEAVEVALKHGHTVNISGFGSFEATQREARLGRNPRTGEQVEIKATKAPRFKPGKGLKQAVNG
jgi:DNA-binding protein HU-beta